MKVLSLTQADLLAKGIAQKVDEIKQNKEDGKGLSSNDYTDADKLKVDNISAGANINIIERVKVNGTALNPVNKEVNIDLSTYATKSDITSVYKVKGSKASLAALPTTGNLAGDVWNVNDSGANYVWTGTEWDKLSETVDLTPYAKKTDLGSYLLKTEMEETTTAEINSIINGLFV